MTEQEHDTTEPQTASEKMDEAIANSTTAVQRDRDPMEVIGTGLFFLSFFLIVGGSIILSTDMFAGVLAPGSKERSLFGLVLLILGIGDMIAGYIFMRKIK